LAIDVSWTKEWPIRGTFIETGSGNEVEAWACYTLARSSRTVNVTYCSLPIRVAGSEGDRGSEDDSGGGLIGGLICNSITDTTGVGFRDIRRIQGAVNIGVAGSAKVS
jgi:hypothetical protein